MSYRCHHDCTGPPWESSPSPRPEPLVAVGYETSVRARPCRSGRRACLPGGPSWGGVSPLCRSVPARRGWKWLWAPDDPGVCPPPLTGVCVTHLLGAGVRPPSPQPEVLWLALRTPRRRSGMGARPTAGGHIAGTRGCPWCPPSGTAGSHAPVCYHARSTRGVPMCFAHPRLTPSFVCLRPVLPCARVLWCEAYGLWLLACIGRPRVHHLEGEVPPAIWRCGLCIEISAIVHRGALGPSFCGASPPVRRCRGVALWLGALRPVASGFLLCLPGSLFLRPSLLPIRPEPVQVA